MSDIVRLEDFHNAPIRRGTKPDVFFDRPELDLILNLYAAMVAAGEWRDYAIGHGPESCCFAIFRRTADVPLLRIMKTPRLQRRQGAYSVVAADGRVLRRGQTLRIALADLERKRLKLIFADK